MVKKIHLSIEEIQAKIQKLEQIKSTQEVKNNKTKRKRVYQQLAKLEKALNNPNQFVVDPTQELKKQEDQKTKRISKKLQKKQQLLHEIKNEKRHQKRCLKCGSRDHLLGDCPTTKGGFCYKCGSKDHSHNDCEKEGYKLADCFYCGKKGHIARDCELNEKGLYKKGGSCFGCGSVRHTLKDCPVRNAQRSGGASKASTYKNVEEF